MRKMTQALGITAVALFVAGCESYDDRPFVMACQNRVVGDYQFGEVDGYYTDNFPFHAGGIPLPKPDEMLERVGESKMKRGAYGTTGGYFSLGGLTKEEGKLPQQHTTKVPLSVSSEHDYAWKDTGLIYELDISTGLTQGSRVILPSGSLEVEHYYMGADRELHPIQFRLAGLRRGTTIASGGARQTRIADIASLIPADAKYAVYKMTWDLGGIEKFKDADTFTMWRAEPLTKEYRYRPNDYEASLKNTAGLGEYIKWSKASSAWQWPGEGARRYLPPKSDLGGPKGGYSTVECFAKVGDPVDPKDYMHLKDRWDWAAEEKVGVYLLEPTYVDFGAGMYIGQDKSNLDRLPDDPDDFTPDSHFLWNGSDPMERRTFFPL